MIVEDQSNLKEHFAGLEDVYQFGCSHVGGVNYSLFTAFPFICEHIGVKTILMDGGVRERIPQIIQSNSRHTIMDSGLFTLMFGSHKGDKDAKFIDKWYSLLVEFVQQSGFQGSCVEVDCQKVLGPETAWKLRKRMRKDLPNNRIINVLHIEDGKKGLDRMIEFSEYMAISVPELRHAGKKGHVEQLANYIKNKKPEIDIHLLGCTEVKLLDRLSFCTSSDSTSWKSILRYGEIELADGTKKKYRNIKQEAVLSEYGKQVKAFVKKHKLKAITERGLLNYSSLALQANQLKQRYTNYAGSQN